MNEKSDSTPISWSIKNHLGHEVGFVEVQPGCDAISAYASKVDASSERLRAAGYTAVEVINESKASSRRE